MSETPDIHDRIQALDTYTNATRAFTGLMNDLASTQQGTGRARILRQMCDLTRQRADLYTTAFGERPTSSGLDMADAVARMAQVLAALAFTEVARACGGLQILRCPATPALEAAAGPVLDKLVITADIDEQFRLMVEDLHDAVAPVLGEYAAQIVLAIAESLREQQPGNQPSATAPCCGGPAPCPDHAAKPGTWLSEELDRAVTDPTKVLWPFDAKAAPAAGSVVHGEDQAHGTQGPERIEADVTGMGMVWSTPPRPALAAFFAVLGTGIALSAVLPELSWPSAVAMTIGVVVAAALAGAVAGSVAKRLTNRSHQPRTPHVPEEEGAEARDVHVTTWWRRAR